MRRGVSIPRSHQKGRSFAGSDSIYDAASWAFRDGEWRFASATGDGQRALNGVFKEAGVPDGHAHRFRDTFAVELLKAGVPMERASVLLGHSSIRVTERDYSPWVRARQEQLEAYVRRTWQQSVSENTAASTRPIHVSEFPARD
jgi:integrase